MIKEKRLLRFTPAVFAVHNNYAVTCLTEKNVLLCLEIGGKRYYDDSNGVIRCRERSHTVSVPIKALDESGKYSVVCRKVVKRLGDYTETLDEVRYDFAFKPVKCGEPINIYQIADAHQKPVFPERAAKFYGDELNLLVINGDTFDYLNKENDFDYLFRLIQNVTEGKIPVIFAKGNHDNRGAFAECLERFSPTFNGKSYYTFRLGEIWGVVLDCGENCVDESPEYGHTVCHHLFRVEETEFIERVIEDRKNEYEAEGVKVRVVISHAAINNVRCKPFDIERDIYGKWVKLINENVKPDFMMSGHLHITRFCLPGDELDTLGLDCPFIIGADPVGWQTGVLTDYIGLAVTIDGQKVKTAFTDSGSNVLERNEFTLKNR